MVQLLNHFLHLYIISHFLLTPKENKIMSKKKNKKNNEDVCLKSFKKFEDENIQKPAIFLTENSFNNSHFMNKTTGNSKLKLLI